MLRKVKREGRGQPTARWMDSITMVMSAPLKDLNSINSIPHNLSINQVIEISSNIVPK